jgi:WD40 repeat protein
MLPNLWGQIKIKNSTMIRVSRDGRWVVKGVGRGHGHDNKQGVSVIDVATGAVVLATTDDDGPLVVAIEPRGQWLVSVGGDIGMLRKRSVATGEVLVEKHMLYSWNIVMMDISNDSRWIAMTAGYGIDVVDAVTLHQRTQYNYMGNDMSNGPTTCVRFVGPHNHILAGLKSSSLILWSEDGNMLLRCSYANGAGVHSVNANADVSLIVSSSWDQKVRVWDGATGQLLRTSSEHVHCGRVIYTGFAAQDSVVVSLSSSDELVVWDSATLRNHETHTLTKNTRCIDLSVDGRVMAVQTEDGVHEVIRGGDLPWAPWVRFRFDGSNFWEMKPEFRSAARTFLLCCLRHRREGDGVLEGLPRDMRQEILVALSLSVANEVHK